MDSVQLIELIVLAAVAAVIAARLYATFGRRTGAEPPPRQPAPPVSTPIRDRGEQNGAGQAGGVRAGAPAEKGLAALLTVDPGFEPNQFLAGARKAYEMILAAFSAGDRDSLRRLLTEKVFKTYDAAIAAREASGEPGPELVRLRRAEIADIGLEGALARVAVGFEAELAEGAQGVRDTREVWTFERDTRSRDPNWRLAGVAAA